MKVEVEYEGIWYECEVLEVDPLKETCVARYDDGGDEEPYIDITTRVRKVQPPWVVQGMAVEVMQYGSWQDCTVLKVSHDGKSCSVQVDWDGSQEADVDIASCVRRPLQQQRLWEGMLVEVKYDREWYDCEVVSLRSDGRACTTRYIATGDEEPDVDVATRVRTPRLPLYTLALGEQLRGTIRSVQAAGAWVDVGAEQEGFLCVSRLSMDPVGCVRDLVDVSQEVDVWVCGVDTTRARLELTLVDGWVGGSYGGRPPAGFAAFRKRLLSAAAR